MSKKQAPYEFSKKLQGRSGYGSEDLAVYNEGQLQAMQHAAFNATRAATAAREAGASHDSARRDCVSKYADKVSDKR